MHRSNNGVDHFYTADAAEAACCGYWIEALNYFYIYDGNVAGTVGLYRCVIGWDHFLSTDPSCEGTTVEGLLGYIGTSAFCGGVPLYRLVLTSGDHFFTTSADERATVLAGGAIDEGITGHVWSF
jgi:hypothetical protein